MKILHLYIPMLRTYAKTKGLSERQIKKRLEKDGWITWRGGSINITRRNELYPNVRKKYELLEILLEEYKPNTLHELQLLCSIHHGMPDFLCFRNEFKFVECKFKHEQLSKRQKICFQRLLEMGFKVEVHKLVNHETKVRRCIIDFETGKKDVREKQLKIKKRYKRNVPKIKK